MEDKKQKRENAAVSFVE